MGSGSSVASGLLPSRRFLIEESEVNINKKSHKASVRRRVEKKWGEVQLQQLFQTEFLHKQLNETGFRYLLPDDCSCFFTTAQLQKQKESEESVDAILSLSDLPHKLLVEFGLSHCQQMLSKYCLPPITQDSFHLLLRLRIHLLHLMHTATTQSIQQRLLLRFLPENNDKNMDDILFRILQKMNHLDQLPLLKKGPSLRKSTSKQQLLSSKATLGVDMFISMLEVIVDEVSVGFENCDSNQQLQFLDEVSQIVLNLPALSIHISENSKQSVHQLNSGISVNHSRRVINSIQSFLFVIAYHATDINSRTLALTTLLHIAAARGSFSDFLLAINVLLGIHKGVMKGDVNVKSDEPPTDVTLSTENKSIIKEKVITKEDIPSAFKRKQCQNNGSSLISNIKPPLNVLLYEEDDEDTNIMLLDSRNDSTLYSDNLVNKVLKSDPNAAVSKKKDHLLINCGKNNVVNRNTSINKRATSNILNTNQQGTPKSSKMQEKNENSRTAINNLSVESILRQLLTAKGNGGKNNNLLGNGIGLNCNWTLLNDDVEDEDDREVFSCGQNSYGELGFKDTTTRKSFEKIESLSNLNVVEIGGGNEHTLVLCSNGTVLSCGYNDNGQCGHGSNVRIPELKVIRSLQTNSKKKKIEHIYSFNGSEHSFVVNADKQVSSFGYNYRGQLGHGNTASESVPTLISSLRNQRVRLVTCSYYHSILCCEDGQLYSFGRNDYGQLGLNDTTDRKIPEKISCQAIMSHDVVGIGCGQYHTVVGTQNGGIYSCGKNDYGQLGIESVERQKILMPIIGRASKLSCIDIKCGYYHSIFLCSNKANLDNSVVVGTNNDDTGSVVFACGRNDYGQLGLGDPHSQITLAQPQRVYTPQCINELNTKDIVRISCGCYHSICVGRNGMIYVFGRNNHGQLGTGDTDERSAPFSLDFFLGKRVAQVSAGFYHTVVLTGGKDCVEDDSENIQNEEDSSENSNAAKLFTPGHILSLPEYAKYKKVLYATKKSNATSQHSEADTSSSTGSLSDPTVQEDSDCVLDEREEKIERKSEFLTTTPIDTAIILMSQLDRLAQAYIPKPGIYPTLDLPKLIAESSPTNETKKAHPSLKKSLPEEIIFPGCTQLYCIDACKSSTFRMLNSLLRFLRNEKILMPSKRLVSSLSPHSATEVEVYLFLGCLRLVKANIAQLLRSGIGKACLTSMLQCKLGIEVKKEGVPGELVHVYEELVHLRTTLLELLQFTVKSINDKSSCKGYPLIQGEIVDILMIGFELFYPCPCLQKTFLLYILEEYEQNSHDGEVCQWSDSNILPSSCCRSILLEPTLRRMSEDSLVNKLLPLKYQSSYCFHEQNLKCSVEFTTLHLDQILSSLVEKIACDTMVALGNVELTIFDDSGNKTISKANSMNSVDPDVNNFAPFISLLNTLQKHVSSWAGCVKEWKLKNSDWNYEEVNCSLDNEAPCQNLLNSIERNVGKVFAKFDLLSGNTMQLQINRTCIRIPNPWRCLICYSDLVISHCIESLQFVCNKEPIPSPPRGARIKNEKDHKYCEFIIDDKYFECLQSSLFGGILPSLITCLLMFTDQPVFACALLPKITDLLRLLNAVNTRLNLINDAEMKFNEHENNLAPSANSIDSNDSTTSGFAKVQVASNLPWLYDLQKTVGALGGAMAGALVVGDNNFIINMFDQKGSCSVEKNKRQSMVGINDPRLAEKEIISKWIKSPLFSGGLETFILHSFSMLNQDIFHGGEINAIQVPLFDCLFKNDVILNLEEGVQFNCLIQQQYRLVFLQHFLQIPSSNGFSNSTISKILNFCSWIRKYYSEKDPSYRMLLLQGRSIRDKIEHVENSFFSVLLKNSLFSIDAALCSFNNSFNKSPPIRYICLWRIVAELRKWLLKVRTTINNYESPSDAGFDSTKMFEDIISGIIKRCQFLLFIKPVENELRDITSPCDPSYLSLFYDIKNTSNDCDIIQQGMSIHASSRYANAMPFLVSYPKSKWRIARIMFHTVLHWKLVVKHSCVLKLSFSTQSLKNSSKLSIECLNFVQSGYDTSNINSGDEVLDVDVLILCLIDSCRRANTRACGFLAYRELLSSANYDSVKADILRTLPSILKEKSPGMNGSFLKGLEGVGELLQMQVKDSFADLYEVLVKQLQQISFLEDKENDARFEIETPLILTILQCWSLNFTKNDYSFLNEIGIFIVLHNLLNSFASVKKRSSNPKLSLKAKQILIKKDQNLKHCREACWVLFRFLSLSIYASPIYEQCAIQYQKIPDKTVNLCKVPVFSLLGKIYKILYEELTTGVDKMVSSNCNAKRELVCVSCCDYLKCRDEETENCNKKDLIKKSSSFRRSHDLIIEPRRFLNMENGLIISGEDMASLDASKPLDFSITFWIYLTQDSTTKSRIILARGNNGIIIPYLLLKEDDRRLEVGISGVSKDPEVINTLVSDRFFSKGSVPLNKWCHLAIVYETNKLRLYLNGTLDGQKTIFSTPNEATELSNLSFFVGKIPKHNSVFQSHFKDAASITSIGSFEGNIGQLQYHKRALSPIHVRIVCDQGPPEKKSLIVDRRCYQMTTILLLLSSSSEGILEFIQARWLQLFLKMLTDGTSRVQLLAVRILRKLLPLVPPESANELLSSHYVIKPCSTTVDDGERILSRDRQLMMNEDEKNCSHEESFGNAKESFLLFLIRMAGLCFWNNPITTKRKNNSEYECEIHLPDLPFSIPNGKSEDRDALTTLGAEIIYLVRELYTSSKWQISIDEIIPPCLNSFPELLTIKDEVISEDSCSIDHYFKVGKNKFCFKSMKLIEGIACLSLLGGLTEHVRVGGIVEIGGSATSNSKSLENSGNFKVCQNTATVVSLDFVTSTAEVVFSGIQTSEDIHLVKLNIDELTSNSEQKAIHSAIVLKFAPQMINFLNTVQEIEGENLIIHKFLAVKCLASFLKCVVALIKNNRLDAFLNCAYGFNFESFFEMLLTIGTQNDRSEEFLVLKEIETKSLIYQNRISQVFSGNGISTILQPINKPNNNELGPSDATNALSSGANDDSKEIKEESKDLLQIDSSTEKRDTVQASNSENIGFTPKLSMSKSVDTFDSCINPGEVAAYENFTSLVDENGIATVDSAHEMEIEDKGNIEDDEEEEDEEEDDDDDDDENVDDEDNIDDDDDDEDNDDDDDDDENIDEEYDDDDEFKNGEATCRDSEIDPEYIEELMLMGFPEEWCILALRECENDVVNASTWIVDNLDYLSNLKNIQRKRRRNKRKHAKRTEDENLAKQKSLQLLSLDYPAGEVSHPEDFEDNLTCTEIFEEHYFLEEDGGFGWNSQWVDFRLPWNFTSDPRFIGSTLVNKKRKKKNLKKNSTKSLVAKMKKLCCNIVRLEFNDLITEAMNVEASLSIAYARVFIAEALSSMCYSYKHILSILPKTQYESFLQFCPSMYFRGKQFEIKNSDGTLVETEHVIENIVQRILDESGNLDFSVAVIKFCVTELTRAANNPSFRNIPWTNRDLEMGDMWALKAPNVEFSFHLLNFVLDLDCASEVFTNFFAENDSFGIQFCNIIGCGNVALRTLTLKLLYRVLLKLNPAPLRLEWITKHPLLQRDKLNEIVHNRQKVEQNEGRVYYSEYMISLVGLLHILQPIFLSIDVCKNNQGCASMTEIATSAPEVLENIDQVGNGQQIHSIDSRPCPKVVEVYNTGFVLEWKPPESNGLNIKAFVLEVKPLLVLESEYAVKYNGLETICEVKNLEPSTPYLCRVKAVSELGSGDWSEILRAETSSDPKSPSQTPKYEFTWDSSLNKTSTNLSFSDDLLSVAYTKNEAWQMVLGTCGLVIGQNSWQILIEKSPTAYLFLGVASKQANMESFLGADEFSWGLIGDRALYHKRNKVKSYGERFGEGDLIGVFLDLEKGILSFSKNGVDMGVAFENVCGELYPAVAFYTGQQKVTLVKNSLNCPGVNVSKSFESPPEVSFAKVSKFASLMHCMVNRNQDLPTNWLDIAYKKYNDWLVGRYIRCVTRAGYELEFDVSNKSCSQFGGFLAKQQVRTPRGQGTVVGVAHNRLWFLVNGEEGAWFFDLSQISPTVTATPPNSDDNMVPSIPLTQIVSTKEKFGEQLSCRLWSIEIDGKLVDILNKVNSSEIWNLSMSDVIDLFKKHMSDLMQHDIIGSDEKICSVLCRLSLLYCFNQYFYDLYSFFDLSCTMLSAVPMDASLVENFCDSIVLLKSSIWLCSKDLLIEKVLESTASHPKKADDDYDYPEDLPMVLLNRPKAAAATAKGKQNFQILLSWSLFGQAFEELHFLENTTLRMIYSHPMDDGQKRSFKVKFEGEGVDDYGGPYRECFGQFATELQALQNPDDHSSSLSIDTIFPLLIPCPNWRNGVGNNREKFVLNPSLCDPKQQDQNAAVFYEMYHFLGQMIGIAFRTKVLIRLDFATLIWKYLVGEKATIFDLKEIDQSVYSMLEKLENYVQQLNNSGNSDNIDDEFLSELTFSTYLSNGDFVDLCENGRDKSVTRANLETYITMVVEARLNESKVCLSAMKRGLVSIIPERIVHLLTWQELERRICGCADVDIDLLQANTEYDEELSAEDEFIQRFWRVLRSFDQEDRCAFLRFVWARSRLPLNKNDFVQKFKIQAACGEGTTENPDHSLPKSHTCFFSLSLPHYSTDEICAKQFLYAIRNCVEMDGDFCLGDK